MMRFKDKLKFFPIYVLSLLPLGCLYWIANGLHFVLFSIIAYRKKTIRENLHRSFPDTDPQELKIIEKNYSIYFCDLIAESIKGLSMSKKNVIRRFVCKNPELIHHFTNSGKNVIWYAGHLGNWEWYFALPFILQNRVVALYLPLNNNYFDSLMKSCRSRLGMEMISSAKGFRNMMLIGLKQQSVVSVFIGDQSPPGGEKRFWTSFLHQDTAFSMGAEFLAVKTRQAVVFPKIIRKDRGYYEIELILLWDGLEPVNEFEITRRYTQELEKAILQQKFNWLWSHRRWKLKQQE